MTDKEAQNAAAADPGSPMGPPSPATARRKTLLWWLLGTVCLLAGIGSLWQGHYQSAPCYLAVAALSLPPVARRLPWKIPDNWKYFLILAGLMAAALLANPPETTEAPRQRGTAAQPAPQVDGR